MATPMLELKNQPPSVSILKDIYRPLPKNPDFQPCSTDDATGIVKGVLRNLSAAVAASCKGSLSALFRNDQAYWRDMLAMTYHLRTFTGKAAITSALLKTNSQRGMKIAQPRSAACITASPSLSWIECLFDFTTASPAASCLGRIMLLSEPVENGEHQWKIWSMSTWLDSLDGWPEDEQLLKAPGRLLASHGDVQTDVAIIGAGNAGLTLAARLKALNVDYLALDKNENIGDNWALRYDCLRFHIGKSFCETPFLPYPEDAPADLSRDDLANQMKRFAATFSLNVLLSTRIKSTSYDPCSKGWTLRTHSKDGERVIICKHLVLATGPGFGPTPNMPEISNRDLYTGLSMHSMQFKNAKLLAEQGVKSAAIIGSANTAFDVIEDCYNAGLATTMIQRSPTYIIPMSYLYHPNGFGMFDHLPAEVADPIAQATPLAVGGQLVGMLHAQLAATEPNRYAALNKAGFRSTNCTQSDLTVLLFDRCGGHFVDMGTGIELIASGKVGIRSGAVPAAYTTTGLKLSDGSAVDADAVIWCTGFGNVDGRESVPGILGEGGEAVRDGMDATWGVDAEGEIRGMWKRHEGVENFWIVGGGTAQHRWFSKVVALQIKAALEGVLPEAWRD